MELRKVDVSNLWEGIVMQTIPERLRELADLLSAIREIYIVVVKKQKKVVSTAILITSSPTLFHAHMFQRVVITVVKTTTPSAKRIKTLPIFSETPVVFGLCEHLIAVKQIQIYCQSHFMGAACVTVHLAYPKRPKRSRISVGVPNRAG